MPLFMSLNITKACPLIFNDFRATISRICPNWEKMAYSDFFSSEKENSEIKMRQSASLRLFFEQTKT